MEIYTFRHKSPGIDQIPTEPIKAGGRTIRSATHKLTKSAWNKEELPGQWNESVTVPVYRVVIQQSVVIIEASHFHQPHTKFYPASFCQV
jgi:hypothetical protein